MSYDNANNFVETFQLPLALANATAAGVFRIRVPTHKGIRFAAVEDIKAICSTTIVSTTTSPQIQIGTAGTPGKFVAQPLGTPTANLTAGQTWSLADVDGRVAAYNPQSGAGKGSIDCGAGGDGDAGAAIRDLLVSTLIGTGGAVAGAFSGSVTIRWF